MKKISKKKIWIAIASIVAVLLIGLYMPLPSSYEQTLKGFVYQCNEEGKIINRIPTAEVTVKVDVNRHKFLLSDHRTLSGRVEFSTYFKDAQEENVAFVLESRYGGRLADNQVKKYDSVEGVDQDRALEKKEGSEKYFSCSDIYYEDNEAYSTGVSYKNPQDIPVYREMQYSENFDRLMWIDYYNQYVYICAEEEVSSDAMLGYFPEVKMK